jgi:hypothetical protein
MLAHTSDGCHEVAGQPSGPTVLTHDDLGLQLEPVDPVQPPVTSPVKSELQQQGTAIAIRTACVAKAASAFAAHPFLGHCTQLRYVWALQHLLLL